MSFIRLLSRPENQFEWRWREHFNNYYYHWYSTCLYYAFPFLHGSIFVNACWTIIFLRNIRQLDFSECDAYCMLFMTAIIRRRGGRRGRDCMLVGFTTNVASSNPAQARCSRYNIIWLSLLVTYDRSVVFSEYSGFLHQ